MCFQDMPRGRNTRANLSPSTRSWCFHRRQETSVSVAIPRRRGAHRGALHGGRRRTAKNHPKRPKLFCPLGVNVGGGNWNARNACQIWRGHAASFWEPKLLLFQQVFLPIICSTNRLIDCDESPKSPSSSAAQIRDVLGSERRCSTLATASPHQRAIAPSRTALCKLCAAPLMAFLAAAHWVVEGLSAGYPGSPYTQITE